MTGQAVAFFPNATSGATTTTFTSLFIEGLLTNTVSTRAAKESAANTNNKTVNKKCLLFIVHI